MASSQSQGKSGPVPRRKKVAEEYEEAPRRSLLRDQGAFLLVVTALFLGSALWSYQSWGGFPGEPPPLKNAMGPMGGAVADILMSLLGWSSFVLVISNLVLAQSVYRGTAGGDRNFVLVKLMSVIGALFTITLSVSTMAAAQFGHPGGGLIGSKLALKMVELVDVAGTFLIGSTLVVLAFGRLTGKGPEVVVGAMSSAYSMLGVGAKQALGGAGAAGGWLLRRSGLLGKAVLLFFILVIEGIQRAIKFIFMLPITLVSACWKGFVWVVRRAFGIAPGQDEATPNSIAGKGVSGKLAGKAGEIATDALTPPPPPKRGRRGKVSVGDDFTAQLPPPLPEYQEGRGPSEFAPAGDTRWRFGDEYLDRALTGKTVERRNGVTAKPELPSPVVQKKIAAKVVEPEELDEDPASDLRVVVARPIAAVVEEDEDVEVEGYEPPPLSLLTESPPEGEHTQILREELVKNAKRLEQALLDFRIAGRIVEAQPGPVITLYQFEPAPGIKVGRVTALADDLALALKVGSVRVYAPVPGKGTVGIEVPNSKRELVRLRDVLASEHWKKHTSPLALGIGHDTAGEPFVADLATMPHLLIAGATGTGKSVCLNSILISLLYRNHPEDLKFILIDPKMLELSVYEDIPHLTARVVTNPRRAKGVLLWAVEEMERRYRILKDAGVRDLASYNATRGPLASEVADEYQVIEEEEEEELEEYEEEEEGEEEEETEDNEDEEGEEEELEEEEEYEEEEEEEEEEEDEEEIVKVIDPLKEARLPRIVVVVDELADLMLTVGREIEDLLARLAQKARAAGIHLILATQRPSVDVITGLIKANFPSRISCKVASRIDARTVLDTIGAEKLLGQGDMLFLSPNSHIIKRMHGAYVSDKEVHEVVRWIRGQGRPNYDKNIEETMKRAEEEDKKEGEIGGDDGEADPLYDQAVSLVIEKGQASTSMVQRVFRIGYNRAARIVETMEKQGLIGPGDGAKPRSLLIPGRDRTI